jgi:hypothetical protein
MRLVSIRWWLPLAFTLIAAGTAAGVGLLLNQRAEAAFQARTHQLAVGDAVYAGNLFSGGVRALLMCQASRSDRTWRCSSLTSKAAC